VVPGTGSGHAGAVPEEALAPSADPTQVVAAVEGVRALPYVWPAAPTAESAASTGVGSCASKHALLAERLSALGVACRPLFVLGALVPAGAGSGDLWDGDPAIAAAVGLVEVHECLTVVVPGQGPLLVDVTWDPPLLERGLPGAAPWDAASDMALAVGPALGMWVPDPSRLRQDKEALRARLYGLGERERRDAALAAMSARFATWRQREHPSSRGH
jgi:hypothetical protein